MAIWRRLQAYLLRRVGTVFQRRGNPLLALWFFKQAVQFSPPDVAAEYAVAKAWREDGNLAAAEGSVRDLLERWPYYPAAWNLLGAIQLQNGRLADAEVSLQRAVELDRKAAPALSNLGAVFAAQDKLSDAEQAYRRALACDRDYVEALVNLSSTLNRMSRYDEAEIVCRRAVKLRPDYAGAHNNLANVLLNLNRIGEAERHYRQALALQPDLPEAHVNLALALGEPAYLIGAIDHYEKVLAEQPRNFLAHIRLGLAYFALDDFERANTYFRTAMEISPDSHEPPARIGDCCSRQALLDEALTWYEQAIGKAAAQNGAVARDIQLAHPEWDSGRCAAVATVPMSGIASCQLFTYHYASTATGRWLCERARAWADSARGGMPPAVGAHENSVAPARRLRVGYVSRDFGLHSVAYFLEPLLSAHDHVAFEIYAYSNLNRPDPMTEKLRALCDVWQDIHMMSDEEVIAQVRADRIDILVDLSGHTGGNRLRVFMAKPAPVQVAYLGYPGTTGLKEIAYRLTDVIADPPGAADGDAVEKLVRLPRSFLCYQPAAWAPASKPAPSRDRGYITFGSFNNALKINEATIAVWAEILRRVEHSRLLLKGQAFVSSAAVRHFREVFARHGIDAPRLDLMAWLPEGLSHLDLYGEVDIALDPFPYNGTTTTCEALWMGVPVVTLSGERHSARVGASLLTTIGRSEWIALDVAQYVQLAVGLANDVMQLGRLRMSLRNEVGQSPLVDRVAHAAAVEQAYVGMWSDWCMEQDRKACRH